MKIVYAKELRTMPADTLFQEYFPGGGTCGLYVLVDDGGLAHDFRYREALPIVKTGYPAFSSDVFKWPVGSEHDQFAVLEATDVDEMLAILGLDRLTRGNQSAA